MQGSRFCDCLPAGSYFYGASETPQPLPYYCRVLIMSRRAGISHSIKELIGWQTHSSYDAVCEDTLTGWHRANCSRLAQGVIIDVKSVLVSITSSYKTQYREGRLSVGMHFGNLMIFNLATGRGGISPVYTESQKQTKQTKRTKQITNRKNSLQLP